MNEPIDTGDRILDLALRTMDASIIVPPGLVVAFAQLVADYAEQHRENFHECCRAVEIGVLQLGMRAMRETLDANGELGAQMGWPKKLEGGN